MTSASIHYAVNGKKDASSDAPAGEVTQLGVRDSHYGWHARCWNKHSTGTAFTTLSNDSMGGWGPFGDSEFWLPQWQ